MCPTLKTIRCAIVYIDRKLRYLTPNEYFRLMGFDDNDCDILKENGISMTQIYKQAGNSIVVNVLEALLKELFNAVCIEEIAEMEQGKAVIEGVEFIVNKARIKGLIKGNSPCQITVTVKNLLYLILSRIRFTKWLQNLLRKTGH